MLFINDTPARWIVQFRPAPKYRFHPGDDQWQPMTADHGNAPMSFDQANELLKCVDAIRFLEYRAVLVMDDGEQVPEIHYVRKPQ